MGFDFIVYKGSKGGKIIEATNHYEDLAAHEVLLKITHSGVCGTDQHYTSQNMVLGHEGVGIVQEIGKEVTDFKM
jgi:threonine dehydrogenase-like Zn-dependent dehydrogenase